MCALCFQLKFNFSLKYIFDHSTHIIEHKRKKIKIKNNQIVIRAKGIEFYT